MGFGFFSSLMILMMLFRFSLSQQPNTDGFFLSVFLKKMGFLSSETYNFSSPVCSWERVFCDSQQVNVIGLMGSGLGLSGFIPDNTIGKLKMLQSLDLSNNKITGFSSDFWSLGSNLKTLNLSYNQISGVLPNDIGNFGILETLDLSFNNFSGIIPESFSSLLSLQILKLNQNWFNGGIPTLNCQNLVSIDISSNRLTEFVPEGFGTTIPKLKTLNLAENEIHGSSSDFLGLKSITHLNISGNNFHGSIMDIFMELLEVVDLSRNRFQGFISHLNSSFNWSSLVLLDLSENELSGEFFDVFDIAYNLKHLNLAHNKFSNQKFPPTEMVPNLEYLNLSQTSIIGEIPTEISHLISLVSLDLSGNWLTGRIPYLGTQNLQVLDLSMNNLTGQIPLSLLRKLPQVERFNFSYNNLTFCDSQLSPETIKTSFIGSLNSCPIAANPDFFRRKTTKHNNFKLVLAITIAIVCFFGGLVCLVIGFRRRTKMLEATDISYKEERNISGPFSFKTDSTTWVADVKLATAVPLVIFEKPLLNYTFADLLSATSHFNQETLMAEGRFGPVYRGFLPGGFHVAVKVLVHVSTMTDEEVARELEYLGRVRHPNLVPLTGYCLAGDQRIAIYDYMENGNLQNLLHDDHPVRALELTEDSITDKCEEVEENSDGIQNVGSESLLKSWRFRHRIALGIARALAFLHHGCCPPIIHRDVKASSIYIDSNFEPRLSDFGLINGQEDGTPHGTPGYTAPESLEQENDSSTLKSDVYGFGVVLFELITGKSPVGDDYSEEKELNLVSWVRGLVRKNQSLIAVDPEILERGGSLETQVEEALKIGYLCTADLPTKRPSMHQIVGLLKDIEPISNQG